LSTAFSGGNMVYHVYAGGIVDGVLRTAEENSYNISIFTKTWTTAAECREWLREYPCDGLVILTPNIHSDLVVTVVAEGIPAVATSADAMVLGIPAVDTDNDRGIVLAVEHLAGLGHRKIGHLAGTMIQTSSIIRRDAFYGAMARRGLEIPDEYIQVPGYFRDRAYAAARDMLSLSNRPTAICCANDDIAMGAMDAANELGIKVPDDLSIVGYDDTVAGRFCNPPLTSVRQPTGEMGRLAVNLLLQQINGHTVNVKTHFLAPELLVRGSSGPCPA
jgi:DNA-binding LacI/PurR family transcriptional regulator